MLKSPLLPRLLLILGLVAVVLVVAGIYFVFDNTKRYNELAAIDLQPLIATMKDNELNVHLIAGIGIRKRQAEVARNEALALVGVGAVLLGMVALGYTRLPNKHIASVAT